MKLSTALAQPDGTIISSAIGPVTICWIASGKRVKNGVGSILVVDKEERNKCHDCVNHVGEQCKSCNGFGFVNPSCFATLHKSLADAQKGAIVFIEGRIEVSEWEGKKQLYAVDDFLTWVLDDEIPEKTTGTSWKNIY